MDKKKKLRIVFAALGGAAVLAVAAISAYMLWEKPPELPSAPAALAEKLPGDGAPASKPTATPEPDALSQGLPYDTSRKDGIYTILLVGNDDGNGNTDTIMVGKIDTVRHSMDFVSIPRDTLINVDWPVRKINSVYWAAANSGASGIEALLGHVKKLVGFDIDCYAVLDLDAFVRVVDAMGGIYFDLPEPMSYEDYWQGLYLDLDAGYQLLDGYQSMCLCRYRGSYIDGDIGRIAMQHKFLKAAADQFITLGRIPNAAEAIDILAQSTDTNLTASNIAYFIRQALLCRSENINFHIAPNTPAFAQNYSYAFLDLYDWIGMVNETVNPYNSPVGEGDLDLVYLMGGEVYCTTVLKGGWYFDLGRKLGMEPPTEEAEAPPETAEAGTDPEPEAPPSETEPFVPPEMSIEEPLPSPAVSPAAEDWLSYEGGELF